MGDDRFTGTPDLRDRQSAAEAPESRARRDAGYSEQQPTDAGYSERQPTDAGYSGQQPTHGGYSEEQPTDVGYSGQQPTESGYSNERTDRFTNGREASGEGPGLSDAPLIDSTRSETFRERWEEIQTRFVDDPRTAVGEADRLVGDIMTALEDTFAENKRRLEDAWNRGEDTDTETLRLTLQKYRALFGRLLVT